MLIVDGDGHYSEPTDMWVRNLDPKFRDQAPRVEDSPDGQVFIWPHYVQRPRPNGIGWGDTMTPGGMCEGAPQNRKWDEGWPGGYDGKARLADMDTDGIAAAVLYPSAGLVAHSIPDAELQIAIMEALNRFAVEYCSADRRRLYAVVNLPLLDCEAAAAMLRRYVEDHGFVAGMVRPNPYTGNRLLSDPDRDILWATAQDLGVPIAVHEGSMPVFDRLGDTRVSDGIARHVLGHPMEGMAAFTTLFMSGVFERFPDLKVGFMESGSGWLPFVADRIDEEVEMFGWQRPDLTRRACDVIRENGITIGFEGDDRFARTNIDLFGPQCVVWASDYPHRDCIFPGTTAGLLGRTDLTPEEMEAAAGGNAIRFYGLHALADAATPA
jgi:predicted TIM-barrel fold metal-dependent hydrolase